MNSGNPHPNRHIVTENAGEALELMAQIYQSRFIGLKDLKDAGRAVTLKIKGAIVEVLEPIIHEGRRIEGGEKGILIFERPVGKKCELILNKTSYRTLKRAWGDDPKQWIGSSVSVEQGKVNGKEATIVTPVATNTRESSARPANAPESDADDLSFPEDRIPTEDER
jgi:hypothetical protein